MLALITRRLFLVIAVGVAVNASGNELGAVKKATESKEYEQLKDNYHACVMAKARDFLKVSSVSDVIHHAPIACKREFFSIRQFLLSGAFKVDVIDELMDSVATGVEIDLVNLAYSEALKSKNGE